MAHLFHGVDLSLVQKKVLENPKVSLGAAGVAALALLYAFTKSSPDEMNEEVDGLPDYVRHDIDFEFTQRFANRNRHQTLSNPKRRRRPKPVQPHDPNQQHLSEERKDAEHSNINYSPFDPNNPNYSYHAEPEEEEVECLNAGNRVHSENAMAPPN